MINKTNTLLLTKNICIGTETLSYGLWEKICLPD